ncbi:MAG: hypothetical protein FWH53_10800 [Leptospirales bacterium]|nr:hypothetical protein [Leptospirales bacterium]
MASSKQLENTIKRKTEKVAKLQKEVKVENAAITKLKSELVAEKKKEVEAAKAKAKPKAKPKAKAKK